jgi:uncharacterized phage protein (TIGR01671 family)
MREIKFRGLSVNGEWHYGLLCEVKEKRNCLEKGFYISNRSGMPFSYQIRPETIGQYIGLKDKKGKEIYEKDVVKHRKMDKSGDLELYGLSLSIVNQYVVEFEHSGFYPFSGWIDDAIKDMQFEVIGNFYENPELLK